ncbi:MAG: sigma 54-interacting transcriptional regulator, partial [Planctomycetes bacterium]|nr:sigma 54-interacting transcriptional regulator [Planctomycetota bacterium]
MLARVLLVILDDELRGRLRGLTAGPDSIVLDVACEDWLEHVAQRDGDLVVIGAELLGEPVGETVAALRQVPGNPELVVVSSGETAAERARLLAAGCLAVVSSEVPDDAFRETLGTLIRKRREALLLVRGAGAGEDGSFGDYISNTAGAARFLRLARKLSQSDSTVLISGETGVGKERLARAIHAQGPRAQAPFVVVNCGAIPESLLESELFGHEKGAFTGAVRAHRGYFELAHRGTIFLDEIGEMPLHLQVKLLRALQERAIQRIGSEAPLQVDVRIMAATNRALLVEMEEKRFRPDLYYRLSVVTLDVPPLRERREDIPALVQSYFEQFRARIPTVAERVSDAAMQALQEYVWPGNIRELINVVERSVL